MKPTPKAGQVWKGVEEEAFYVLIPKDGEQGLVAVSYSADDPPCALTNLTIASALGRTFLLSNSLFEILKSVPPPKAPTPKVGQVWRGEGIYEGLWLAVQTADGPFFSNLKNHSWVNYRSLEESLSLSNLVFEAESLAEYVAQGGKL